MKLLLVCEYRQGRLQDTAYELLAFADTLGAERSMVLIGSAAEAPHFTGTVYLADGERYGEYDPGLHARIVLEAAQRSQCDAVVFVHSSYGWDIAPRVAAALKAAQISEIVETADGTFVVPSFNSKMRRIVSAKTRRVVLTIQAGAFAFTGARTGTPAIEPLDVDGGGGRETFTGYEAAPSKDLDLARAEVIVSAGRGIGKKENVPVIAALARALGGELGATRPVVDAGWVDYSHQVGSTGQIVSPKLYVACGISGAIQHLAGMKKSEFIVAINKDKEAPICAVADVLVAADVMQFVPAFITRLQK